MTGNASSVRRRLLASAMAVALVPAAANAADTTVTTGQTRGQITFSGADHVTIQTGGTVSTTNVGGVVMSGDSTAAVVDNAGTILVTGAPAAIGTGGSARSGPLTINNSGVMNTTSVSVYMGNMSGPVTLTNSGTIQSGNGTAVITGGGDDVLNLQTGSNIVGAVQLGAGADTINLIGSSAVKTASQTFVNGIYGGETLNVNSGYWTQTGGIDADVVNVATGAILETSGELSANGPTLTANIAGKVILNTTDTTYDAGLDDHINGSGQFELTGGGVMQYGASVTLSGLTTVTNGTLVVTGAAPSAVSVGQQGVLRVGAAFSAPDVEGDSTLVTGGSATGSIGGNIANAGKVFFDRSNAYTYAGVISGTGSVTQAGPSVLTLSGANTYTGATSVTAGGLKITGSITSPTTLSAGTTLEVAVGGSSRFVTGDAVTVTNAGTIETFFTTGTAGSITLGNSGNVLNNSGSILSHNGHAVLFGSGDDVLNLLTGSNIVGDLQLGAGVDTINLIGSSAVKTASQTFVNGIYGGETLNVNSGYWTQTGGIDADVVNVATGAILETSGELSANGPTLTANIAGKLILNTTDTTYDAGVDDHINGTGQVELTGGGIMQYGASVTLSGLTTLTNGTLLVTGNAPGAVSVGQQGVLHIGAAFSAPDVDGNSTILSGGGATGSIGGNIANAGQVIFDRSNAYTYAGVLSGTGAVKQTGSGVLTLSGANTYTGATSVTAGGLKITGSITSPTTLSAGTTLEVAVGGSARFVGGDGATITNAGTIETFFTTGTAGAITLGNSAHVLNNSGAILSHNGHAVVFGSGNDVLNLSTGSNIVGDVQLGAGVDTVNLAGSSAVKTATQSFSNNILGGETLNVNSGYWSQTGAIQADVVNVATGATLETAGDIDSTSSVIANIAGKLVLNSSDTSYEADADSIIKGTGQVELIGGGALQYGPSVTLTGLTTVTNGTLLVTGNAPGAVSIGQQGTLRIGAAFSAPDGNNDSTIILGGGATGSVGGDIVDNGKVIFDRSNAYTYAGAISGTGSVTKAGSGVLTLTGATTYTGGTIVSGGTLLLPQSLTSKVTVNSGGTLQIGTGGTLGEVVGDIVANGTVIFNRSDDYLFAGAFSGNGTLIKRGAGKLTLDGVYTFSGATTIEGGTIKITQLNAGGALVIGVNSTIDLSGASQTVGGLAGGAGSTVNIDHGSLTITPPSGSGTTTFSGVIAGAGSLTVAGSGVVDLTGTNTYTGSTTIDGGTLKVNGAISSATTVNSGGTLGGAGTINAPVVVNPGGKLSPGNSPGVLNIVGPLTLAAGSITAIEVDPTATPQADRINVSGTTTIATGAKLAVAPLGAIGNYARSQTYTIISAAGGVSGKFAVADITSSMPLLTPVVSYTANAVSLRLLRNDITFASLAATANQRAVAAAAEATGVGAAPYEALVTQSQAGARAGYDALSGEAYGAVGALLLDETRHQRQAMLERTTATDALGAWGQVIDASSRADATAVSAGAHGDLTGLALGADTKGGAWVFGGSLAYGDSGIKVGDRSSHADVESWSAGLYSGRAFGAVHVAAGLELTEHKVDATRSILFPSVTQTVAASYDASTWQAFAEASYPTTFGGMGVEPFAGLAAVSYKSDGFSETGGTLALTVAGEDRQVLISDLGVRFSGDLGALKPNLSLAWRHAGGDVEGTSTAAFGASAFTVEGAGLAEDSLAVDAGITAEFSAGRAWLGYSGVFSDNAYSGNVKIGAAFRF